MSPRIIMQKLETKTVAVGVIKGVRAGAFESVWPFFTAVKCRPEAIKGARKKIGVPVGEPFA